MSTIGGSKKKLDENDYERMAVKGTCQKFEKEYIYYLPATTSRIGPSPLHTETTPLQS